MRLGTAIVLLALGAILTFAIEFEVSGVDLRVVGWILMIVGALGIVYIARHVAAVVACLRVCLGRKRMRQPVRCDRKLDRRIGATMLG